MFSSYLLWGLVSVSSPTPPPTHKASLECGKKRGAFNTPKISLARILSPVISKIVTYEGYRISSLDFMCPVMAMTKWSRILHVSVAV